MHCLTVCSETGERWRVECVGFLKLSELQAAAVGSRHLVVPHVALDVHQQESSPTLALSKYIGDRSSASSSSSCSDGLSSSPPSKRSRTGDSTAAYATRAADLSAALADLSSLLERFRTARNEARQRATDTPALLVPLRRALLEQKLAALAIIRALLICIVVQNLIALHTVNKLSFTVIT